MSTRPVPVPRTCQAMYVVLTPRPLGVDDTLPLPSAALLRHHGTSAAALERFEGLRHQRVLHHRVPVERAVDAAVELRVEALRLAEEHDGVVVDLTVPRVLELGSHEVSAGAASQWYVLDAAAVLDGRLQTDGLVQFGLLPMLGPVVRTPWCSSGSAARIIQFCTATTVGERIPLF